MNLMPSEVQRAWVAGIIDADGCVTMTGIKGRFRHPHVVVDSTDLEILDELTSLYGGSLVKKRRTKEHHRQAWSWRLYGSRAILAFLGDIVPYMRCPSKLARATVLLNEYIALTPRNGHYTVEQGMARQDMEDRFMAIGYGRGASTRQA